MREKIKQYLSKTDDQGSVIKAKLTESLAEAIAVFSDYAAKEQMAEKHRDWSMMQRVKSKLQEREKEKQRMKDELRKAMGDEYEEEEENKDEDEDSALDEEEKEYYDKGTF